MPPRQLRTGRTASPVPSDGNRQRDSEGPEQECRVVVVVAEGSDLAGCSACRYPDAVLTDLLSLEVDEIANRKSADTACDDSF
jgi:hypothetical protein